MCVMEHSSSKPVRDILDMVTKIVRRHLPDHSYRILLFGSWARSDAMPTSDIDIGILGKQPVNDLTMARIREELDELPTLRKVEIVDLQAVDDRFREHVVQHAEPLA